MADFLAAFGAIAATLFVTELTDKDAILLIAVSTKAKARLAFLSGITAFTITTSIFVTFGSLLLTVVPVLAVKVAGGAIMLAYGLWELRGLVGFREAEEQEEHVARSGSPLKVYLSLVAALAFLDIAGDATEVLTIVFVAHYGNYLLVFASACTGLFLATAFETALGSRLGRFLTPGRLRYGSAAVFLLLGFSILLLNL